MKDKARLLAVVDLLVVAGADPEHADRTGRTPSRIARRKRDAAVWMTALGTP